MLRFKSPTDTPIHICLLSGHSAVIGPEWRELPPLLHRDALIAGCVTDNMDQSSIDARVEAATPDKSRHEILVEAVGAMYADNAPGHITQADLPNLKVLSGLVGWAVSKEDMMQAVHAVRASKKAE